MAIDAIVVLEATGTLEAEDFRAGHAPTATLGACCFTSGGSADAEAATRTVLAVAIALAATAATGAALAWLVSYLAMSDCRSSSLASPLD